ncbi:MAG: PorV/PorQ family protein [candidate division WOR-3 bacterium]
MKSSTLLILTFAGSAWAQAGLFLKMGAGGRELGMGGAVSAISVGPSSVFWNPAGLSFGRSLGAFAQHTEYFQGIRYDNLALAKRFGFGTIGLYGGGLYVGGFEGRTGPSHLPEWEFSCFDFYAGLAYSKKVKDLSLGASGKFFMSRIDRDDATAFAVDLGGIYSTKFVNLGASLQNLGGGLTYIEESSPLPTTLRLGLGFKPFEFSVLSADFVKPFFASEYARDYEFRFGAEATIADILSLRTGLSTELEGDYPEDLSYSTLSAFWFGAGVRVEDFDVDYAFRSYDALGYTHRVSLTYSFGRSREKSVRAQEGIALEYQRKIRITAESFYASAMSYYSEGNLTEALTNLDRALVWDPEYSEAQAMYDKIKEEKRKNDAESYYNRGLELYNQGNFMDAITQFERCLEIDPENSLAQKWQEASFSALVEVQKAKYSKKQEKGQEISELMKKGVSFYSKGDYFKAEERFKEVLKIDPQNAEAKDYLAKSEKARKDKAADYLRRAEAARAKGDYAKAIDAYQKVFDYEPGNPDANKGLVETRELAAKAASEHLANGRALYKKGDLSGAEAEFRAALNLDPSLVDASSYLAEIAAKRRSEAKVAPDPKTVEELYLKGVDAYVREDYKGAIYYWEKVLELDPNHAKAKANLAKAKKKISG